MEDRLQKFAQLVDAGSFTRAAEQLHISQPALSTAISKLERELHTTLLIRGTRSLKLTQSGEVAYAHAKESAVRSGNLKLQIAATLQAKLAVRVGMIDSLADVLITRGSGLSELEKHASVSLIIDNSRNLTSAIIRDDMDLAFVVAQPHSSSSITPEPIGSEPLVFVCQHTQQADMIRSVRRGNLPSFISYNEGSTTFQLVQTALNKHQVTFHPTLYSTSPEVIRKLVLSGKGAAVLPYLLIGDLIRDHQLATIPIGATPIIDRPIQAIRHRDKLLSSPLLNMIKELKELLSELSEEATILNDQVQPFPVRST
jgi:LysR family transcriptional regulator, transcriptional activator of the cysJI operon